MKNRRIAVCLLSLIILVALRCGTASALAPTADPDRIVVLMSVDGLANFYMDDPAAEMPTIRKLAAEGAKAAGMRASDPTVTWPNHTTLVTGVSPARHGVVGNNYYDRAKGEKVTLIWDPVLDKDEIVKVPTIYDLAKAAGLKTAAIHWPATRNARSLDWTSPDVGKAELVSKYTTPELLEECKAAGSISSMATRARLSAERESIAEDEMWTQVFNMLLHKHRPNLALLHVLAVDHTEHSDGPRSEGAYEAIKAADGQVRQVWEQLQKDYPGQGDADRCVGPRILGEQEEGCCRSTRWRRRAWSRGKARKITGGAVQLVIQGGSAFVYVADEANRDDVIKRVKKAFEGVEGVAKVVTPDEFAEYGIGDSRRDPHAPDMLLEAKLGYYFGDTAAGGKKENKGSHGHDSHLPELHATFVAWGKGIKPGTKLGEIDNKSVAPTIAKLLGIEMPNVEGKALTEALAE